MQAITSRFGNSYRYLPKITLWKAFVSATFTMLLAAFSTGCSIHPVQQDVTGIHTSDIVDYLLCETRLGIQDKAIELLTDKDQSNPLIELLIAARGQPWDFEIRSRLNNRERSFYDRYIQTGIAYDFSFDITEDNSGSAVADPIRLITNGIAGVGLSAGNDFKRENLRHFIVSDTFQDLLLSRRLHCEADYRSSNYAYPIAGKIGIDELISTFIDLNEFKSLSIDKSSSKVFADTLTFSTTLMASVSPHVIVAAAGNRWGLASPAAISASGSRVDKHSVIIGLSLDVPKALRAGQAAAMAVVPGRQQSALQKSVVASPAEQSALDAVNQARIDAYLDRAIH